jgi:hypothetical protein
MPLARAPRGGAVTLLAISPVVGLLLGACRGSDPAGAGCVSVSPCGGDIAGTWQLDSECFDLAPPFAEAACAGAARAQSTFSVSGTIVYAPSAADPTTGTMQIDAQSRFVVEQVYSPACLAAIGSGDASPAACDGLQAYFTGPYEVTCAPASNACVCQIVDEESTSQSGTYTIANQQITSPLGTTDYCRTGDTLVQSSPADPMSGLIAQRLTMHLAP